MTRTRNQGSRRWWRQRLSALTLIPLALLFLYPFASTLGRSREAVLATYANPLHASVAAFFFLTLFTHLHQGLREVIEDYVHGPAHRRLLVANTTFCAVFALTALYSLAKIALFS